MTETQATTHDSKDAVERELVFADVLCAVDGTWRSYAAVEQAAVLAGQGAELTLLAVTAATGSGPYKSAAIGHARTKLILHRAGELARRAGVHSTSVVDPAAPPARVIIERAAAHDLVALGAPVMSRLGEAIVGGVATEALGPVPTALLFARRPRSDAGFAKRILVASDGMEDSEGLVARAGELARAQHADVQLLHVIDGDARVQTDRVREQARRIEAASGCACEIRIQEGPTSDVIVQSADESGVSLVVMGTRRLSGIRAIGSVSRRVVHDASCSVLLIPPDGRG